MSKLMRIFVKLLVVLIFLAGMQHLSSAQSLQDYFITANQAYTKGDYSEATVLYEKIIDQGYESGEVYFNLGNCYYKLNEIGLAILNYEKAKTFIGGDPALEQNLRLARLRVVDQIDSIPKLFLEEWWDVLIQLLPLNTLLWLCLTFFTLSAALWGIWMMYNRIYIRRLAWIFISIFTILLILSVSKIYEFETTQFGIILDEKVSVVSEPDLTGTEVFILHEGTKVKINRQIDGWLEITIPDGKTGWLQNSSLGVI